MKYLLSLTTALLFTSASFANDVTVLAASLIYQSSDEYYVHVTLQHEDTGWEHYADEWRIVDAEGNILGSRVLHHPHVDEQPFARGLRNVKLLAEETPILYIEAHDKVHGWSPQRLKIDLNQLQNGRLTVKAVTE